MPRTCREGVAWALAGRLDDRIWMEFIEHAWCEIAQRAKILYFHNQQIRGDTVEAILYLSLETVV